MEIPIPETHRQEFQPEPAQEVIQVAVAQSYEGAADADRLPQDEVQVAPTEEADYSETVDRLEEIYRERRERIVQFVMRKRFVTREDAEDAVQEAFAQVLRRPHGISQRPADNQPYYMYRAAMNARSTEWRKEKRTTPIDTTEGVWADKLKEQVAYDEFGAVEFGLTNVSQALTLAVQLMPSREQFIIKRMIDGQDQAQIAEALRITPGTLRTYVGRIRKTLRAVAKKEGWYS